MTVSTSKDSYGTSDGGGSRTLRSFRAAVTISAGVGAILGLGSGSKKESCFANLLFDFASRVAFL